MDAKKQAFFEENAALAMEEQIRYGIPASVTLIQMFWESSGGTNSCVTNANNYFGVKEHRKGVEVYHADDRDEKNAPFKVYDSKEASVRDHSLLLMTDTYKRCCGLSTDDYKGWLKGIKASGYASAKDYDKILTKDLEVYNLQKYDKQAMIMAQERGKQCGYMREQTAPGERVASLPKRGQDASRSAALGTGELFRMPLDGTNLTMTCPFGPRIHPTTHKNDFHNGVDIAVPVGTKLYSTEAVGVVKRVNWGVDRDGDGKPDLDKNGNPVINGKCVEVEYRRGNDVYTVQYLHMSRVDVMEGQTIGAGTLVGLSGDTGRGTGAHLHYGVMKNNKYVNPLTYLADMAILSESNAVIKDVKKGNRDALAEYKNKADRDQLQAFKADAERQQSEQRDLASAKYDQTRQESRDLTNEETVERTAKANMFSAILGEDGSGLGQIFQGGTDITSGIVKMLFMSFLALAFNKHDDEQQQELAAVQPDNATLKKDDYDVRESRETVQKMADQASTAFDLQWPESQGVGQQISQQNSNGYSVG